MCVKVGGCEYVCGVRLGGSVSVGVIIIVDVCSSADVSVFLKVSLVCVLFLSINVHVCDRGVVSVCE